MSTRTALVTGGASGIGLACAERLTADGLTVAAADVQADALAAIADRVSSVHTLDVTDAEAVGSLVAELGSVDLPAGVPRCQSSCVAFMPCVQPLSPGSSNPVS